MSGSIGNPAPIGLMAFALSIFMLGALNAGLVDARFKELVGSFGFWWAGIGQVMTGLFELLHGNSFGALIFWTYGSLWMSLSTVWHYARQNEYAFKYSQTTGESSSHGNEPFGYVGAHHYRDGEALMLSLFGCATLFFFIVSLRKNRALPTCLFILTFSFIFAAIGEYEDVCKKIAGWGYMATGLSAFYILMAEIVNEEWGYAVIPGIAPVLKAKPGGNFEGIFQYDKVQNSVFLNLGGIHVMSQEDVQSFETALDKDFSALGNKAHVVVNYKGVEIAPTVLDKYHAAVSRLQEKYYLTVKRFAATAFRDAPSASVDMVNNMTSMLTNGRAAQAKDEVKIL